MTTKETTPDYYYLKIKIERLTKWASGFERLRNRVVPGFALEHESRIETSFWREIDHQCFQIAIELGDKDRRTKTFVHSGGFVQFRDSSGKLHMLNTPTRFVNYFRDRK